MEQKRLQELRIKEEEQKRQQEEKRRETERQEEENRRRIEIYNLRESIKNSGWSRDLIVTLFWMISIFGGLFMAFFWAAHWNEGNDPLLISILFYIGMILLPFFCAYFVYTLIEKCTTF